MISLASCRCCAQHFGTPLNGNLDARFGRGAAAGRTMSAASILPPPRRKLAMFSFLARWGSIGRVARPSVMFVRVIYAERGPSLRSLQGRVRCCRNIRSLLLKNSFNRVSVVPTPSIALRAGSSESCANDGGPRVFFDSGRSKTGAPASFSRWLPSAPQPLKRTSLADVAAYLKACPDTNRSSNCITTLPPTVH